MITDFIEKWEKNKKDLEDYFRNTNQSEYSNYGDIVKLLFEKIINKDEEYQGDKFDIKDMKVIDDGDWQGTQIFILHKDSYHPSVEEYVYTNTYYGSCSGCDTLLAISGYSDGLPSKEQVQDYMTLALHLLQRCKYMQDED